MAATEAGNGVKLDGRAGWFSHAERHPAVQVAACELPIRPHLQRVATTNPIPEKHS